MRDPVSAMTHFAACAAAVAASVGMLRKARRRGLKRLPVAAFAVGMVVCYAASATYHTVPLAGPAFAVFRMIDYTGVYLLIAGTDTPVVYFLLRDGHLRRVLLWTVWSLAAAGVLSTWLVQGLPYWAIVLPYIALGWIAVVPLPALLRAVGWRRVSWLAAGGVLYTTGALIDWLGPQRLLGEAFGAHEVFHLLTIAGTICHVTFVWRFVLDHEH